MIELQVAAARGGSPAKSHFANRQPLSFGSMQACAAEMVLTRLK
jgi:hypothetical protein